MCSAFLPSFSARFGTGEVEVAGGGFFGEFVGALCDVPIPLGTEFISDRLPLPRFAASNFALANSFALTRANFFVSSSCV